MPKLRSLLLVLLTATTLVACQKVPIEDDPAEQAKAIAVAEKYLKAFSEANGTLVLEMSALPFWGDGSLLANREELEKALLEQFANAPELTYRVKSARFFAFQELQSLVPSLYQAINQQSFSQDDLHFVAVTLEVEGQEELGVILVKRQQDGIWKVTGIGD